MIELLGLNFIGRKYQRFPFMEAREHTHFMGTPSFGNYRFLECSTAVIHIDIDFRFWIVGEIPAAGGHFPHYHIRAAILVRIGDHQAMWRI